MKKIILALTVVGIFFGPNSVKAEVNCKSLKKNIDSLYKSYDKSKQSYDVDIYKLSLIHI